MPQKNEYGDSLSNGTRDLIDGDIENIRKTLILFYATRADKDILGEGGVFKAHIANLQEILGKKYEVVPSLADCVLPGESTEGFIDNHLSHAYCIVVVLSADLLADNEAIKILERARTRKVKIIFLNWRPCLYNEEILREQRPVPEGTAIYSLPAEEKEKAILSAMQNIASMLGEPIPQIVGKIKKDVDKQKKGGIDQIPFSEHLSFKGRKVELKEIEEKLKKPRKTVLIYGLGGMGKTQLAVEYAYHHKDYKHHIWLDATSGKSLHQSMINLGKVLGILQGNDEDIEKVKTWLTNEENYLLVVDNVEDFRIIDEFIPRRRGGSTLMTSREINTSINEKLAIRSLDPESATELIVDGLKSTNEEYEVSIEEAKDLAKRLGYLPLAIRQAVAYMIEAGCGIKEYMQLYHEYGQKIRAQQNDIDDYNLSVRTSLGLSLQKITSEAKDEVKHCALAMMRICAYAFTLNHEIPERILQIALNQYDKFDFTEAIRLLCKYSLLEIFANPFFGGEVFSGQKKIKMVSIHPLLAEIVKDETPEEEQRNATIAQNLKVLNYMLGVGGSQMSKQGTADQEITDQETALAIREWLRLQDY